MFFVLFFRTFLLEASLLRNIYFSSLPVLLVKGIQRGVQTLDRLEINFRFNLNKFVSLLFSNCQWHFICEYYIQMLFVCNDILDIFVCMYMRVNFWTSRIATKMDSFWFDDKVTATFKEEKQSTKELEYTYVYTKLTYRASFSSSIFFLFRNEVFFPSFFFLSLFSLI